MQHRFTKITRRANDHTYTESYLGSFKRLATWDFWRAMLVFFCVFSLVGHLIEWPYCAIGAACFNSVNWTDEVLANPLKPFMVYGIGIVLCAIFLSPLKDSSVRRFGKLWQALLAFFVMGVFLGMAMELIQGFLQNQPDENGVYPLWDVHDYPGNILGQAWIVNDLFLGLVFTFATWHIYPLSHYRFDQLGKQYANRNTAVVCVVFVAITVVTYFFV